MSECNIGTILLPEIVQPKKVLNRVWYQVKTHCVSDTIPITSLFICIQMTIMCGATNLLIGTAYHLSLLNKVPKFVKNVSQIVANITIPSLYMYMAVIALPSVILIASKLIKNNNIQEIKEENLDDEIGAEKDGEESEIALYGREIEIFPIPGINDFSILLPLSIGQGEVLKERLKGGKWKIHIVGATLCGFNIFMFTVFVYSNPYAYSNISSLAFNLVVAALIIFQGKYLYQEYKNNKINHRHNYVEESGEVNMMAFFSILRPLDPFNVIRPFESSRIVSVMGSLADEFKNKNKDMKRAVNVLVEAILELKPVKRYIRQSQGMIKRVEQTIEKFGKTADDCSDLVATCKSQVEKLREEAIQTIKNIVEQAVEKFGQRADDLVATCKSQVKELQVKELQQEAIRAMKEVREAADAVKELCEVRKNVLNILDKFSQRVMQMFKRSAPLENVPPSEGREGANDQLDSTAQETAMEDTDDIFYDASTNEAEGEQSNLEEKLEDQESLEEEVHGIKDESYNLKVEKKDWYKIANGSPETFFYELLKSPRFDIQYKGRKLRLGDLGVHVVLRNDDRSEKRFSLRGKENIPDTNINGITFENVGINEAFKAYLARKKDKNDKDKGL